MARTARRISASAAIAEIRPTVEVIARKFARQAPRSLTVDTRDMEQDAYVGVLQALARYNGSTKVTTFMRQRVFGSMVDGLRRWDPRPRRHLGPRRVIWEPLDDYPTDRWVSPSPDPATLLQHAELRTAVDELPAYQRDVLIGFFWQGETQSELAERFGITIGAVWQRRADALKKLRAQLT